MTAFAQAMRHWERGELDRAIPWFNAALQQEPENLNVIYRTMLTLVAMRKYEDCARWLEALLPHIDGSATEAWMMAGFHYNLAIAHEASGRWSEAERHHWQALVYDPDTILSRVNLGGLRYRLGEPEQGRRMHDEALVLKPDREARATLAFIHLLRGDYLTGFREYEYRWTVPQALHQAYIPEHSERWHGEHMGHGKRMLVVAEQGLGDVLMMARYVPRLIDMGISPILIVHGGLVRLMRASFPDCEVYGIGEKHPQAGWWVPMMSLPREFRTTLDTIPPAACLKPPSDGIQLPPAEFRVGHVGRGNPLHMGDKDRSCYRGEWGDAFNPIVSFGREFIDLEERALKERYGVRDFGDTASIIAQCDLIISIDSAVAHCAGAMDKPVWLVPPCAPEWRWLLDRDDSPWYPRHRLYRRRHVDDWPAVIERIRTDLEGMQ